MKENKDNKEEINNTHHYLTTKEFVGKYIFGGGELEGGREEGSTNLVYFLFYLCQLSVLGMDLFCVFRHIMDMLAGKVLPDVLFRLPTTALRLL